MIYLAAYINRVHSIDFVKCAKKLQQINATPIATAFLFLAESNMLDSEEIKAVSTAGWSNGKS